MSRLLGRTGLGYPRWAYEGSQPSRVTVPYMQRLADEGNGSVERRCWSCDKTYRPGEHEHYYREPRDNAIPDRLCPKCAAHVQAELGAL